VIGVAPKILLYPPTPAQSYGHVIDNTTPHRPYQGSSANRDSSKHLKFPISGILTRFPGGVTNIVTIALGPGGIVQYIQKHNTPLRVFLPHKASGLLSNHAILFFAGCLNVESYYPLPGTVVGGSLGNATMKIRQNNRNRECQVV